MRRTRLFGIALLFALLFATSSCRDRGSPTDTGQQVEQEGSISGTVFYDRDHDGAATTGEGMAGLAVAFLRLDGATRTLTVTTAADGSYAIDVAPGSYAVSFPSLPDTIVFDSVPPVRVNDAQSTILNIEVVVAHEMDGLSVPISTVVLDSTSVAEAVTSDGGATLTLPTAGPGVGTLRPGDILVAGVTDATPRGLLRKVEAVSTSGDLTTLTTTPATLADAVANGSFRVERRLTRADLVSFQGPAGVSLAPEASGSDTIFSVNVDHVLFDADGDYATTEDQIRLNGPVTFSTTVILDGDVDWFSIPYAKAGVELNLDSDLAMDWAAQVQTTQEISVGDLEFLPIPFGPFLFFPSLSIRVGIDGSVSGEITTRLNYSAATMAAVEWKDGSWHPVSSFDPQASAQLTGYVNASASAYIRIPARFDLYGVVGPSASVKTYVQALIDPQADPWWQILFGASGQAAFDARVLSGLLPSVNIELFNYQKVIAEAEGPFVAHPTAAFDVACTELTCTFTDQSTDSTGTIQAWNWSFGDDATSSLQNPSHSYGAAGTYTVALSVTDDHGGTDSATQDVTVALAPVSSVAVAPATAQINVGGTKQFVATPKDASGNTLTDRTVTWSSSNTSVATVNASTGLATGVAPGTATITATSEGKSGSSALTVSAPPPAILPAPTLLTPANGATGVTASTPLAWSAVSGATYYILAVATTSSAFGPELDTPCYPWLCRGWSAPYGTTDTLGPLFLPNAVLYWRVQAVGPQGPGQWSTIRSFRTGS